MEIKFFKRLFVISFFMLNFLKPTFSLENSKPRITNANTENAQFVSPDLIKLWNDFRYLELFSDTKFNFPKSVWKKNDILSSTVSTIYGLRLSFKAVDFKWYQATESIKFTEVENLFTDFFNSPSKNNFSEFQKKPAWSFSVNVDKLSKQDCPLTFYVGSLSFAESMSKFRSPSFYAYPSCFCSVLKLNTGLGISTASKTTSSKPLAFATTYNQTHFSLQTFVTENTDRAASLSLKLQPGDFFRLQTLFCFYTFNLYPKIQSTWTMTQPYFTKERRNAFYSELLFAFPIFTTKLSFTALDNPFDTIRFCSSLQTFLHAGLFSVNIDFFATDLLLTKTFLPIITTSGDLEKNRFQTKVSPTLTFNLKNDTKLKTGITALYSNFVQENSKPKDITQSLFVSSGFQVESRKNIFSLLYKINDSEIYSTSNDLKQSISAKLTTKFSPLTFAILAKEEFVINKNSFTNAFSNGNLQNTFTETLGLYFYPKRFPINSISLISSLEHKKQSITPSFTLSVSSLINLKKVKISAKIQATTSLLVE